MIYFDNASTSFPKAPKVAEAVKGFIDKDCFNIGRGAYEGAINTSRMVFQTREMLAELFSATAKNVVFSAGITQSLNLALFGILKKGDTVLTSTMEHNAVMRPLHALSKDGINTKYIRCNNNGELDLADLECKLKQKPKMLVLIHASNVCGTIMPIIKVGRLCKENNVLFVVDCAQTAGLIDINMQRDNIDILCFSGHKGLLAVQGIGGCVLSSKAAILLEPLIFGGTGSFSDSFEMPALLPDRYEAGTLNLPGIVALNASIKYLLETGIENIFKKEKSLQDYFEKGVKNIRSIRCIGAGAKNRCAVSSIDFLNMDNGEAAYKLDSEFGIMTRSGLHCAANAHKTLGTFPSGTVRLSFGHKNTISEVDILLKALKALYNRF